MNRKDRRAAQSHKAGAATGQAALFMLGAQAHVAGRHDEAAAIYDRILTAEPNHADALHGQGLLFLAKGDQKTAGECIERAIAANSENATYYNNLGIVRERQTRYADAIVSFQQALKLQPDDAETINNLAVAYQYAGRFPEALQNYDRALELRPDYTKALYNKGTMLLNLDRPAEAAPILHTALKQKPDYVEAWNNLGLAMKALGRVKEACNCYEQALTLKPDHIETHINNGSILYEMNRLAEAEKIYRYALMLRPDEPRLWSNLAPVLSELHRPEEAELASRKALTLGPARAETFNNLGAALEAQNRMPEAREWYEKALQLNPDHAETHYNLGNFSKKKGELQAAVSHYDQAIALNPAYAEAHWNKAFIKLLQGHFHEGWTESEWRWRRKRNPPLGFTGPQWDGGDLTGKTILLQSEQGLGDTLQFVRYAPIVKAKGGHVILVCPKLLAGLLTTVEGIDQVLTTDDPLPTYDCQCALLTLPGILGTTLENIPVQVPYVRAELEKSALWKGQLSEKQGLKVGLVWAGNPEYAADKDRSPRLDPLMPLFGHDSTQFFGLQKGDGLKDLQGRAMPENFTDLSSSIHDFTDTAAIMENLDLVITSCTAPAHLAGALARPTWILLPYEGDWRWLLDREDSPWYSTVRLFRQPKPGDWTTVVSMVQAALRVRISA